MEDKKQSVSTSYEQTIQKTEDLVFDACCTTDYDTSLIKNLTQEVLEKRYGCGSPIPDLLEGRTVLDLGCGAGADCFIASQLVGEHGKVIGVDMTEEQLAIANRNITPHMSKFGFSKPNIEFRKGVIEEIPVEDNSIDVVISNCVVNLSSNKQAVFNEIWRVLKPGGEFYIADIIADRRIPKHLQENDLLWSECLTGALYAGDLRQMLATSGFADTRTVKSRQLSDVIEGVRFFSDIVRGFKVELEQQCEDYGQVAIYKGTVLGKEKSITLDQNHVFPSGTAIRICKNTADMLQESRFAQHFEVSLPLVHLGAFDCQTPVVVEEEQSSSTGGCC